MRRHIHATDWPAQTSPPYNHERCNSLHLTTLALSPSLSSPVPSTPPPSSSSSSPPSTAVFSLLNFSPRWLAADSCLQATERPPGTPASAYPWCCRSAAPGESTHRDTLDKTSSTRPTADQLQPLRPKSSISIPSTPPALPLLNLTTPQPPTAATKTLSRLLHAPAAPCLPTRSALERHFLVLRRADSTRSSRLCRRDIETRRLGP